MIKYFKHQLDIINEDPKKTGLFLGCGCGKTLTALSLATGKILVIAPKTQVLDKNWEREAALLGKKITVVSKEQFKKIRDTLETPDTLIIDEFHTCAGVTPSTCWVNKQEVPKTSQIFDAVFEFSRNPKIQRIYLCSGTITKTPFCVYAAGKILGKDWNYYEFRNVYYFKRRFGRVDLWMPRRTAEIKTRLAACIKKIGYVGRLDEYFDVPQQTIKDIHIELTKEQTDAIANEKIHNLNVMSKLQKMVQIENGVYLGNEFVETKYLKHNKTEAIIDLAEQYEKLILFARYSDQIKILEKDLKKAGYEVYSLTGETKDRGELLDKLKKADNYIFIVQSQISAGWELPDCRCIIFVSRSNAWNDYEQAKGRILRANNLKPNLYINLVVDKGIESYQLRSLKDGDDFKEALFCETLK